MYLKLGKSYQKVLINIYNNTFIPYTEDKEKEKEWTRENEEKNNLEMKKLIKELVSFQIWIYI